MGESRGGDTLNNETYQMRVNKDVEISEEQEDCQIQENSETTSQSHKDIQKRMIKKPKYLQDFILS